MDMKQKCEDYLNQAVEAENKGDRDAAVRYFGLAAFAEARAKGIADAKSYADSCKERLYS